MGVCGEDALGYTALHATRLIHGSRAETLDGETVKALAAFELAGVKPYNIKKARGGRRAAAGAAVRLSPRLPPARVRRCVACVLTISYYGFIISVISTRSQSFQCSVLPVKC